MTRGLYEILDARDGMSIHRDLLRFMSTPGGAGECARSWLPIVLTFHRIGSALGNPLAEALLSRMEEADITPYTGRLFERFLPDIANDAFDSPLLEPEGRSRDDVADDYEAVARAIAFGICRPEWLPPEKNSTRASCRALRDMDYVLALQALTCLCAGRGGDTYFREEIDDFVRDARAYLTSSIALLNNHRLKWEFQLFDDTFQRGANAI